MGLTPRGDTYNSQGIGTTFPIVPKEFRLYMNI